VGLGLWACARELTCKAVSEDANVVAKLDGTITIADAVGPSESLWLERFTSAGFRHESIWGETF
jgi:hypothetical protein